MTPTEMLRRAAALMEPVENWQDYYLGWRPTNAMRAVQLSLPSTKWDKLDPAHLALGEAAVDIGFPPAGNLADWLWHAGDSPEGRVKLVRRLMARAVELCGEER